MMLNNAYIYHTAYKSHLSHLGKPLKSYLSGFFTYLYAFVYKVVPEGWAVTVTAQPSGTTLFV